MKNLFFLIIPIILLSCTKKYEIYNYIEKESFIKGKNDLERPKGIVSKGSDSETFCQGQIFWGSNAKEITDSSIPSLIRATCPGSKNLANTKVTQTWWTTLVYSRSCVQVEASCL